MPFGDCSSNKADAVELVTNGMRVIVYSVPSANNIGFFANNVVIEKKPPFFKQSNYSGGNGGNGGNGYGGSRDDDNDYDSGDAYDDFVEGGEEFFDDIGDAFEDVLDFLGF